MSDLLSKEQSSSRFTAGLVVLIGLGLGYAFFSTGPKIAPNEEERPPKIVQITALEPATHRISISAHGVVIPARRVVMKSPVSGEIISLHPDLVPGGFVGEGAELFRLDSLLMELSVAESKAAVARAQALLKEARRKREEALRLANEHVIPNTELFAVEADVEMRMAEALRLEAIQSRNEELLRRHVLQAPFNAMVLTEEVEIGQRVDSGSAAITLVGADEFWVRVALPADQLRWIKLPDEDETGASAEVYLEIGEGEVERWSGRVVRLLSDIEREGRMARVLVSVKDPMGFGGRSMASPLLIGSYVRVEIDAGELRDVLAVGREALREGDRVWLCDGNNELRIRDASVMWREDETVFLKNMLESGERLITSPLRSALPGMKLEPQTVTGTGEPKRSEQ